MRKRGENELPPPNTKRWAPPRKVAVLQALRTGKLTLEQARERYALSAEEISAWKRHFERHGVYGLHATRVQLYREDEN